MQRKDDAYQVIWLVRRLFRSMAQKSNDHIADLGVTAADRAVLEFLYPDEALPVPEIAERYQVSRQHVQVTVNRLVAAGLVRSRENPRHKRSPLTLLTGSGKALFRKIRRREQREVESVFSPLPARDLRTTARTLESLLARFNAEESS